MSLKLANHVLAAVLVMVSLLGSSQKSFAQTYPIDCAILLCLSGGWPASVPCTRARAEFIRRITPWPIEPPLQIWRCPMGASYYPDNGKNSEPWIYDALLGGTSPLPQSFPIVQPQDITRLAPAVLHLKEPPVEKLPEGLALRLVQDRADIVNRHSILTPYRHPILTPFVLSRPGAA